MAGVGRGGDLVKEEEERAAGVLDRLLGGRELVLRFCYLLLLLL